MQNSSVKLSIIVPVYKTEGYLRDCLDSILCQSFVDYELICVNDGSPDNSQSVLEAYASKDDRIRIINQENAGLSAARNSGLDAASGDWVLFVDSDDKLGDRGVTTGEELQNLMRQIEDDVDWIVAQTTVLYENCDYIDEHADQKYFSLPFVGKKSSEDQLVQKLNVCAWGKLYKRSFIEKNNLRFPVGLRYEDEYWFPCYCLISKKVKCVTDKLYTYYRRDTGIMADTFKTKSFCVAQDRLAIAEQLVLFYKEKKADGFFKDVLCSRFWGLFCSARDWCPVPDQLYFYWKAGAILREQNLDCSTHTKLQRLKAGEFVEKKRSRWAHFKSLCRKIFR